MVKVNDKSIKVYNLDTINTLLIRVSTELQTLPKYLYFNDGVIDIQQFYKDITNFSFNHSALGATNLLFNTSICSLCLFNSS